MELEALALAVDERIRVPAAERRDGHLYAVRCEPDAPADPSGARGDPRPRDETDDDEHCRSTSRGNPDGPDDDTPPPSCPAAGHSGPAVVDGVVLELLARGEARTLPQKVRPPVGIRAIALTSGVWAAPMEPDGPSVAPSQHPERRRAHLTVVVGTEAGHDGVGVSVLRYGDGSPTVLRGGVGLIHQRMLRCWSRRPDAPWATRRPPAAA